MQLIVEKLLTHYLTVGNGKKVALFLHGWADSVVTFDSLAKQFIKENPDYTAVLIDLPGFGKTQAPQAAWGLDDYAKFLAVFIKKSQYEPSLLIGHSNGGAIAIHGIAAGYIKTDGLVLIASAGIREPSNRNKALRVLAAPAKVILAVAPKATQRRIKQKAYSAIGSDYMVSEAMQDTFKKIVSTDVTADAGTITIPTQLIYGSDDSATPVRYGQQLKAAIPNAKLAIVPQAGHFVHQEQVYKVSKLMTELVRSL